MARGQLPALLRQLQQVAGGHGSADLTDRQLLECYAARRDEGAFAELVQRHGRLVLGVCWRVLHHVQDVEDAFQATFLVLARKAASLRWHDSISNWLYEVANRLAAEARRKVARRRAQEQRAVQIPKEKSPAEPGHREVARLIDEELQQLPERFRAPLLLCYLEGRAVDQAARQLGWSLRTMERRLQHGRKLLRGRLARRGLSLSAPLASAMLVQDAAAATVSAGLVGSTIRLASLFVSSPAKSAGVPPLVLALAQGMLRSMGMTKVQAVAILLAAMFLTAGGGAAVLQAVGARQSPAGASKELEAAAAASELAKPAQDLRAAVDRYGDPLPQGAISRLGTVRYRIPDPLAFALDGAGKSFAFGTDHGLWLGDVATGRILRHLATGSRAWGVAFSPDGGTLAANEEGRVEVWDVPAGRRLHAFEMPRRPYARTVVFSPDGARLAADHDSGTIHCWDVKTGKEVWARGSADGSASSMSAVAFAPDGKTLVSLENRGESIVLLDSISGAPRRRLKGAGKGTNLVFSPDLAKYAAGPDQNWKLHLVDARTGKELHTIPSFRSTGEHFAFSHDGKTLAWSGEGQGIRLVDVASGKVVRRVATGLTDSPQWLHFLPGDKSLAFCSWCEESVRFWDLRRDQEMHTLGGHRGRVQALRYTPDARSLISAAMDDTIRFWDPATGREFGQVLAHRGGAWCLAVAPDGKTVASGSLNDDKVIRFWDTTTHKETRRLEVNEGVQSLAFSPSGTTLLCGNTGNFGEATSYDPRLWDVATGKEVRRFHVPGGSGCPATFSPDGKYLACQSGASLLVWEAGTGRWVRQIPLGKKPVFPLSVTAVAFSPDSRTLVSVERDATLQNPVSAVRFWELASAKERLSIPCPPAWYADVCYSPDGKVLAVADAEHCVRLLDAATGKLRRRFAGHHAEIDSLAFAPDGKSVASASADTTILVWGVADLASAGPNPVAPLTARDLEELRGDLASADAARAYRAIGALAARATQSVSFLREHMHPASALEGARVARLIAALDHEQFAVRQKAADELAALEELVEAPLRKALAGLPSAQGRRTIQRLLEDLAAPLAAPESLRLVRAVELLERLGTAAARDLLQKLATGAPAARLTQESQAALQRLGK
jgi:RNA polymerase sigma factor (sigma-70 family)